MCECTHKIVKRKSHDVLSTLTILCSATHRLGSCPQSHADYRVDICGRNFEPGNKICFSATCDVDEGQLSSRIDILLSIKAISCVPACPFLASRLIQDPTWPTSCLLRLFWARTISHCPWRDHEFWGGSSGVLQDPKLGNVPFFSVLDGVMGYGRRQPFPNLPPQVPTIHMACPWVSWLGCLQGLHYTEPLSLLRKEEALVSGDEIWPAFRRRVESWHGFSGILLDGTFVFFVLIHWVVYHLPYWYGFTVGAGLCHSTRMGVLSGGNLQKSPPSTAWHPELSSGCRAWWQEPFCFNWNITLFKISSFWPLDLFWI